MSQAREQDFWDRMARGLSREQLRREARLLGEEPLWGWARAEIAAFTPQRVLDLGCGRGATTLLLAGEVPAVVGVDVALGALTAARRLAATEDRSRAPVFAAAALERLPFGDHSFDLVAGRFVLHHAAALDEACAEIARVLRPGGRAVFVETWGANPALGFGRELAALLGLGIGSDDERPLGAAEIELLASRFSVTLHWPHFMAFGLSDRLWRRMRPLVQRSALVRRWVGRAWQGALDADRWVEARLPAARRFGWFVGIVLEKR